MNSNIPTTDREMIIWLHDKGRETGNTFYREVADRFSELVKTVETEKYKAQHKAMISTNE